MGEWFLQSDPARPGQQVWVYDKNAPRPGRQPAVTMIHPVVQPTAQPRTGGTIRYQEFEDHQLSGQDDLSDQDETAGELVNTEKLGPLDDVLIQPSQDPNWRPA